MTDSSWTLLSILLESSHKDKEMSDIGIDRSPSKKLHCQREGEREGLHPWEEAKLKCKSNVGLWL